MSLACPHDPPCPLHGTRYGEGYCVARTKYAAPAPSSSTAPRAASEEAQIRHLTETYGTAFVQVNRLDDGSTERSVIDPRRIFLDGKRQDGPPRPRQPSGPPCTFCGRAYPADHDEDGHCLPDGAADTNGGTDR